MPSFPWSIYIFLVPCVFQIFLNFLELKRTKYWGKVAGIAGFILLSLGLALLIVVVDVKEEYSRQHLIQTYRWSLILGAFFWLLDQILWIRLRIKVV